MIRKMKTYLRHFYTPKRMLVALRICRGLPVQSLKDIGENLKAELKPILIHFFISWTWWSLTPFKFVFFTPFKTSEDHYILEAWEYRFFPLWSLLAPLTCVAEASSLGCCSHCCRYDPGNHWGLRGQPAAGRWRRYWSARGYLAKVNCSLPRQPSEMKRV